ncbi:MAG: hypothetical protein P8183_23660, partial [Anaerolineae bacterium]
MLKRVIIFIVLASFLAGCKPAAGENVTPIPTLSLPSVTAVPTDIPPSAIPSATYPPEATAVFPTLIPTPAPPDLSITKDSVSIYPVPRIYTGDKVTFQVRPYIPPTVNPDDVTITVFVDGLEVGSGIINDRSLNQDAYGLIKWAWATSDRAGTHQVQLFLDINDTIQIGDENPNNNQITFPVVVYDRGSLPAAEANATWVTAETNCCRVHVVSGTAAYRDLPQLLVEVETAMT